MNTEKLVTIFAKAITDVAVTGLLTNIAEKQFPKVFAQRGETESNKDYAIRMVKSAGLTIAIFVAAGAAATVVEELLENTVFAEEEILKAIPDLEITIEQG